jgi:hypothetical protein
LGRGDKNVALWNCKYSKHAYTFTIGAVSHCFFVCFFAKIMAMKAPRDLHTLAMSQVSYTERSKTTMVTKNWTSKVGLSRFPNNENEAFFSHKQRDFP